MQDHRRRTYTSVQKWSTSELVTVIGIILVLIASSYMAYNAIDEQARRAYFMTGRS